MAKLVIQTQCKENYGAHDWDGKGECPKYWKFKGGNTYVMENLSEMCKKKILSNGIPNIASLISKANNYWEEYILDWSIEEDEKSVCEHWEKPSLLEFTGGKWMFSYVNWAGKKNMYELGEVH